MSLASTTDGKPKTVEHDDDHIQGVTKGANYNKARKLCNLEIVLLPGAKKDQKRRKKQVTDRSKSFKYKNVKQKQKVLRYINL